MMPKFIKEGRPSWIDSNAEGNPIRRTPDDGRGV